MFTWFDSSNGIRHAVTNADKEGLAIRTACDRFVDIQRNTLEHYPLAVTCLLCFRTPSVYASSRAMNQAHVDSRGPAKVRACKDHLLVEDEFGGCAKCGYKMTKKKARH